VILEDTVTLTSRKALVGLASIAASAFVLAGCAAPPSPGETQASTDYLPCEVSDDGGFDDHSFNELALKGLQDAAKEIGAEEKHVESGSEDARDVAAELEQYLQDYVDLADDVGPIGLRDMSKGAFELVQRLEALGCAVSIGRSEEPLRFRDGSRATWPVGTVVVALVADVKPFAAIPRGSTVKFS